MTRRAVVLLGLLAAACMPATPPATKAGSPAAGPAGEQVPPYASQPYQPFSRAAAVAIARREWRAFRRPVVFEGMQYPGPELPVVEEREEGLWQRVGDYWWLGLADGSPQQRWTGMHDESGRVFPFTEDGNFAWSAAFIDYVMRMAGAGSRFPYSERHSHYINAAARRDPGIALNAERPQDYAPRPGDLICMWRSGRKVAFEDLPTPAPFPGHCDIAVAARPGVLDVIGGNVDDAVAMKHVAATPDGRLARPDGTLVDAEYP